MFLDKEREKRREEKRRYSVVRRFIYASSTGTVLSVR